MHSMRALIVDDEPLSRDLLRSLLEDEPAVTVVGEAGSGREAVEIARRTLPDLLFLDVQMPELDGFEVVHALDGEVSPAVIFVTAYDQYAVRAFEVHAFDYLLKPFDRERLRTAVERAHTRLTSGGTGGINQRLLALLEQLAARGRSLDRIVIRTPERAYFLRAETVDWIEAAGKFVHLHAGKTIHALRESMQALEQQLDPQRFMRIGRSAIVNVDRIQEIQPWFQGDYVIILLDGTRLTSTRGYRENLQRLLGK